MSKQSIVKTIAYLTNTLVNYFHQLGLGNSFCRQITESNNCKEKKNFIKKSLKQFLLIKRHRKINRQITDLRKYREHVFDKGLVFKIHIELI